MITKTTCKLLTSNITVNSDDLYNNIATFDYVGWEIIITVA